MGYYSTFTLVDVIDRDGYVSDDVKKKYVAQTYENLNGHDVYKWYDFADGMKEISKVYPGVTFCATRIGEDAGDFMYYWFTHGEMHSCPAVLQPTIDYGEYHKNLRKSRE